MDKNLRNMQLKYCCEKLIEINLEKDGIYSEIMGISTRPPSRPSTSYDCKRLLALDHLYEITWNQMKNLR